MKLLIIAYYYPPINTGGTQRPLKMGQYLPQFGHDVTILTHTYGKTTIEAGNPPIMRVQDISFNKGKTTIPRKLQWLGLRLYTELLNRVGKYHSIYSWWLRKVIKSSEDIIQQVQPDVIIATYPPIETLEIGLHLSKTFNIPLLVDFRDGLIFESIESKRIAQYSCIRDMYKRIEAEAVTHAHAVTTIAQPISDYFQETYATACGEVISNGFDPVDWEQLPALDVPFDDNCFNIVFTGRFGLSDKTSQVEFFFAALRQVIQKEQSLKDRIKIHLVGEYSTQELRQIQDLIRIGVIQLHGFVSRQKALTYQRAADLLLIITSLHRTSLVTGKIFEYLYAGKPILALTYKTVLEKMIQETRSGWTVHPQQTDAIAQLLQRIFTEPGFYESYQPDSEVIQSYSIQNQLVKLNHLLEKIKK
jgi:glycosyltransferase involved in cell wall biosynthesis